MPRVGQKGRGDLFVEASVVVPTVAEDRERALLQEFARLHPSDPRQELAGLMHERPAGGRS
jgi:DnaJ-class molecular chaperone